MSFNIDPRVKFTNNENCYCFFHAIQQTMQGVRIKSEIYDNADEYDCPRVCVICLDEERIAEGSG
jgi:hypothetical protein